MNLLERFLGYVQIHTTSDETSKSVPSAQREFDLAVRLEAEMQEIGITGVRTDEHCYVYGWIPASPGYEHCPAIGLIAHIDTAPDFSGEGVKPQVIAQYDGQAVLLGESGRILSPEQFPHLKQLAGSTLITTDGSTLLGADDKAGIAVIMETARRILSGEIPHGKICIAFTPDEEIGSGAEDLDLDLFGADFGYTIDGGAETDIEYENFNACSAEFQIKGFAIHPGEAKNAMINAALVAMEINQMLPGAERPSCTEGYEGFYHLTAMQGNVEKAELHYIIRDHDAHSMEARKKTLRMIEKRINESYGPGTAALTICDSYHNMAEKIEPCMHLIRYAQESIREIGLTPRISPIRGGTDGARLSFRGLPCPNLGAGGYCFHGPYEHITLEGMERSVQILLGILKRYADTVK